MKTFIIDSNNNYENPEQYTIGHNLAELFNLYEGEDILVYDGEDEWIGTVGYNENYSEEKRWYVELKGGTWKEVSLEKQEGRSEGFDSGMAVGEINGKIKVAKALLQHGFTVEIVRTVTGLSHERIHFLSQTG